MSSPSSLSLSFDAGTDIPDALNLMFHFDIVYTLPGGRFNSINCTVMAPGTGTDPLSLSESFSFTDSYNMDFPNLLQLKGVLNMKRLSSRIGELAIQGDFEWDKGDGTRCHYEGGLIEFPPASSSF